MKLKQLLVDVLLWRVALIAISLLAIVFIPLKTDYMHLALGQKNPTLFGVWSNFDGFNFLEVAKHGYGSIYTNYHYAFFPVYPMLIKAFNIFNSYLASGLLVSHLCLILALFFLYRLVTLDYSPIIGRHTILLLLAFPTSFFFGSVYSESLFLLLSVLTFYLARKKHYLLAGIVAAVASATKVTGIFLWPAIALEFFQSHQFKIKKTITDPKIIWLLLPPIGLLSYLRFQFLKTGDFLFFIHQQPGFGANRVVDKLILLHQVFYRYVKMLIFVDHASLTFFIVVLEFLIGLTFLVLCVIAYKKLRHSYFAYCALAYLLPTLTGTLSSFPRYAVVLFPLFILLSLWYYHLPSLAKKIYLFISIILGIITTAFFTRGYFVG